MAIVGRQNRDDDIVQAATQFSWSESDYESSPRPPKRRRLGNETPKSNGGQKFASTRFRREGRRDSPIATPLDDSDDSTPSQGERSKAALGPPDRTTKEQSNHEKNDQTPETGYGAKKNKISIHAPKHAEELNDVFYTQPPPPDSSPYRIRGPIWQKKPRPLSPLARNSVIPSDKIESEDDEIIRNAAIAVAQRPHSRPISAQSEVQDSGVARPPPPVQLAGLANPTAAINIAQEMADIPSDAFASSSSSSSPVKLQDDKVVFISSQPTVGLVSGPQLAAPMNGLRQKTLFGDNVDNLGTQSQNTKRHNWPIAKKDEPPTHHKLNQDALKTWIYPTNLGTIRDYQYNIVHRGLYHNLLVALPTGLGKTFIAATVMLNWFRWTKEAQIVFVAPTKPLVSQQVEACFGIAGIPRSATSMLTGGIAPGLRAEEWNEKRIFFMTPQTIINDLKTGICDPKKIVLLVVDEAHRATGGYAYVEVVKFLRRFNQSFRILALTATPGSTVEGVQQVIDGLDIARVEIRTENSLDIRQFVHTRHTETMLFDFSDEQSMCMEFFSKALQPLVSQLNSLNAYWGKDPMALTPYGLTQARAKWMSSDAGRRAPFGLKGKVNSIITILASLAHSIELLKYHGIAPFYRSILRFRNGQEDGPKSGKYHKQINEDESFDKLLSRVRRWINDDNFIGHPKLEYLQEVVLNHFVNASEGHNDSSGEPPSSTRIMVFAHFRDSAEDIVRVLKRHDPMVRPHLFVGQHASKGAEGMDQKHQLEVIQKFKKGVFNTLVATSIGEEGLDIGEVDLIICYDSSSSPIRMLQRMGRTGRKRQGNIVLLLMKGKEENSFSQAKDNYERMQAMIATGDRFSFHEDRSSRIVPRKVQPVVDKRVVEIPTENTQKDLPEPTRRGRPPKRPKKRFNMPDDVHTGFMNVSEMLNGSTTTRGTPRSKSLPRSLEDFGEINNPSLGEVILGQAQEKELSRKYTYVYGDDDDNIVRPPRLDAFPKHQRTLRKTKRIGHSWRSQKLVQTLSAIHSYDEAKGTAIGESLHMSDVEAGDLSEDVEENEELPISDTHLNEVEQRAAPPRNRGGLPKNPPKSYPRAPRKRGQRTYEMNNDDMEAPESSAPKSSARMRLPSQAVDLGSYDTSGEDIPDGEPSSELRDFVVDDDDILSQTSSLPDPSQVVEKTQKTRERQRPLPNEESDDDDLPAPSQVVGKTPRADEMLRDELDHDSDLDLLEAVAPPGDIGKDNADVSNDSDVEMIERPRHEMMKKKRRIVDDSSSE
ncbi:MAG: 3'-5' DNA helicase [Bogoriella megaspora]|nr:MAG: 3'-5' DNA helicase [Bogoriella megaspora]